MRRRAMACDKALCILREHPPTPLKPDAEMELARIVAEGSKELLGAG